MNLQLHPRGSGMSENSLILVKMLWKQRKIGKLKRKTPSQKGDSPSWVKFSPTRREFLTPLGIYE
jgi:hypothetical protein